MKALDQVSRKRILFAVAHPDDETLWLYQCIQMLKVKNQVAIFCATYSESSSRGRELLNVADRFGFQVFFGGVKDPGIGDLLNQVELESSVLDFLSTQQFDWVITHPPHGGEKPHPHHIQLYQILKGLLGHQFKVLGFYSEKKLFDGPGSFCDSFFDLTLKISFSGLMFKGLFLLSPGNRQFVRYLKMIRDILYDSELYRQFVLNVDESNKQEALQMFESQIHYLQKYRFYHQQQEFLYLRHPF